MGRINSIRIVGDNPIISKSLVIACALKHYTNRPASTSSVSLTYRSARVASSKECFFWWQSHNYGLLFILSLSEREILSVIRPTCFAELRVTFYDSITTTFKIIYNGGQAACDFLRSSLNFVPLLTSLIPLLFLTAV